VSYIEAILLGIVQGATEFLPISSSGHLLLIPAIFNLAEPDLNAIAFAHQGTLLAVLVYFRRELWSILSAVLHGVRRRQPMDTTDSRLGWYIVVGTIPAIIGGLLLADVIDETLTDPLIAAGLLLVTGLILLTGERIRATSRDFSTMRWSDAISIGLAQTVALLPGISRSGITITSGLARGLDRSSAARYSFLLGVPAIAGAGLITIVDIIRSTTIAGQVSQLVVTFIASFLVGYACIHLLLTWVRHHSLYPFAAYCFLFGLGYLAFSLTKGI
jgi:undecaprenyl-diphosphatase